MLKAQVLKKLCVGCGTCVKACPMKAIKIVDGIFAEVNQDKCVGCSKCERECPASIIEIVEKER
ncbi:4Fe-4S ferredoxin iron-sulfur binding domain-containing protein [Gottschalkia acidurici 9a]|uniref:4Fe-4S ferredoxin iron-sulfur binding domain-containing protein n=1 Tax=Gottschalkia acidurici (strain ATCC 7906 / DSM 604 / BCRC 14475 / CIP 104303 / KCTC 5404 / NCIMB 10678 / 9a) TaxID=1128398 RepID=K0AVD0_GOTA9|nr:4Fe-4S binding protein [Gottschalkia acidurici]AFS77808.1 4Fe-4S ferredoxin iron-sulfur binding domain-containing protein [Gottschalkia acidurici 9a]